MWIVRLALRRTYTFVVVALLIAVLGAVSIYRMATDIFPQIDIPVVSVVWSFTGMPADEIESRIILINERVLTASVNSIEHIESQSLDGVGIIRIYFQPGAQIAEVETQVTATCQTLLKIMPPGITPPYIVRYSATSVPVLQIAVSSETLTEQQIFDYCTNFIIQQLGTVQGARVPQPWGGKQRQVMVDLDLQALYAHGLSPSDVSSALTNQNLIIPAGTAKMGPTEYSVRLNSSPDAITAFNWLPIKTVSGIPIYMKDVAHVRDGYAVQTNIVRRDGRHAVLMTILNSEGASTLSVVSRVRAAMPAIQAQVPPALKMEFLFDQSVFVRAAVEGVLREGAIAAGLTALMILLFLGSWRSTLIVATSIPLAILASIVVLWALGQSLNTMTLGGMALAVGILVDDATVEIENVHRNMAMKKPLRKAILDGAAQNAVPAFVSTLSICIVFVPVLFLTGPAAYLFAPLALAVVFAMLASYFLSRTLVPTMVLYLLPAEARAEAEEQREPPARPSFWSVIRQPSQFHTLFNHGLERLRQTYEGLLAWALDHRLVTVATMLGFAIASAALYTRLGENFFPSVDAGQLRLHVRAPPGTRVEDAEQVFGQVENAIRSVVPADELGMILDNIGLTQSFTIMAYLDNGTVSNADGEILVSLKPNHRPSADYVARLRVELPRRFPECTFYFEPADITSQILNFGLPAPIDVQVVGINRSANLLVAQKLRAEMAKVPGIADVHLQQITDRPDLDLNVDRTMAEELGLTQQDVSGSVLVSLSSTSQVSPNFWVNPENRVNYRVAVQTPEYRIHSMDTLLTTPLIVASASSQPSASAKATTTAMADQPPQLLSNLVDVRRSVSAANINHYNVQPVFDVYANVQGRDLAAVASEVTRAIDAVRPSLPRGSLLTMRGQVATMNSSFAGLATGMVFALLLVYLLMVVNFQSWLDPLIILTPLPGALAGIAWMLYVTQTTLSVPALMGAIMCIGVATSNSILMVTFANDRRHEGADAREAALSAGATRLRPVLMTALAMIIGMLPMSLGLGEGGEENAPLGRAVIGGLLMATGFTLVFVPVMYSLMRRIAPQPPREEDEE